jgi:hypothetical protein
MIPTLQLGGLGRSPIPLVVGGGGGGTALAAAVRRSTSLSVATATNTYPTYDTVIRDDGGMWNAGSPTLLTTPLAGWYLAVGDLAWDGAATLYSNTWLNDGTISGSGHEVEATSGVVAYRPNFFLGYEASAAQMTMACNQYSGSNKTVSADTAKLALAKLISATPIGAHIYNSSTQSIAQYGAVVSFNTASRDDGGCWSAGSPTRLTVPAGQDGWYIVAGYSRSPSFSSGGMRLKLRVNGGTYYALQSSHAFSANMSLPAMFIRYLAAGDYIDMVIDQNAGSTWTLAANTTRLSMVRVDSSYGAMISAAAQGISTTLTGVTFNTTVDSAGGMLDLTTYPKRITVPTGGAGWYAAAGSGQWSASSGGSRVLQIRANGATLVNQASMYSAGGMNDPMQNAGGIVYLNDGDYLELMAQCSTGSVNFNYGKFCTVRLGA